MAHLLAEFSPRDETTDVADLVTPLLRIAGTLGLRGMVNIVAAEPTNKMRPLPVWQRADSGAAPMKLPQEVEFVVALHETCHAVVMLAQGVTLEYVTIVAKDGALGHVKPRTADGSDALVNFIAGPIGVEWLVPGGQKLVDEFCIERGKPADGSQEKMPSDAELMAAITSLKMAKFEGEKIVLPSDSDRHREYVGAGVRALDIIEQHAAAVIAIVFKLMQFKTLSGAHAATLFRAAQRKPKQLKPFANVASGKLETSVAG